MKLKASGCYRYRGTQTIIDRDLDYPHRSEVDRFVDIRRQGDDGVIFTLYGRGQLNGDARYGFNFSFSKTEIARLFAVAFGDGSLAEAMKAVTAEASAPLRHERAINRSLNGIQ